MEALNERFKPVPGLFVAQVVGVDEPAYPQRFVVPLAGEPGGHPPREGGAAQHGGIHDPELGGHFTVKIYESEKVAAEEGGWRHAVVRLKPDSDDPSFEPIVFENLEEGELAIVADLVEVLV